MLFELKSVFLNDGETKEVSYELDMRDTEIDGIFPFISPVQVTASAENRASLVTLTLTCRYGFSRRCDRCTEEVSGVEVKRFEHRLVQTLVDETNDDYIETPDFTLELDEVVMTDLILSYPQKFLCGRGEDCKGLCPVCGSNRNEGDCGCQTKAVDPRLEILKQFMD